MNLLNWKDRDGNGSVTWTAHSTYEIERLEVVTGVFWFCVRRLANAKGRTSGVAGRWREPRLLPRPTVADGEQGDLRGYAPSRACEATFARGLRGLH